METSKRIITLCDLYSQVEEGVGQSKEAQGDPGDESFNVL